MPRWNVLRMRKATTPQGRQTFREAGQNCTFEDATPP
jgi:hypothetical protein